MGGQEAVGKADSFKEGAVGTPASQGSEGSSRRLLLSDPLIPDPSGE